MQIEIGQRVREARTGAASILHNKYAPQDTPMPMTM